MALLMVTKVIAPNLWGWVADHTGKRMGIIKLTTFAAALAFLGVFANHGYWWMALVMCVFSFFWNAALPQFEATTMTRLGEQVHRYSNIRLWGSVGFIVSVVVLGELLESMSSEAIPVAVAIALVCLFVVTLMVPKEDEGAHHGETGSIWAILRRPEVIAMLVVCFLLQASHGPYYTFFTIYMEQHGYARGVIGQLWALGVVAEIGIFLIMHRLMPRYGAYALLLWSLGLTTLRWLVIAYFPEAGWIMVAGQCLHAASFGIYHAVAIHLIHRIFVGQHQGRGQAIYSSFSFGAGGALGSLSAGYIWSALSPSSSYLAAAGASLLALIIAWQTPKLKKL